MTVVFTTSALNGTDDGGGPIMAQKHRMVRWSPNFDPRRSSGWRGGGW